MSSEVSRRRTWGQVPERRAPIVCPHRPHPVRGFVVELPEDWFEVRPAAAVALARRGAA